ncbi:MAG: acyl-homoserine-lactone synthase [Pseudomonadota bacterium]
MIHVVTYQQRAFYAAQLRAMHRRRREVFIDDRGWKLEERDGGEYDRGDDEQAIYLMMLDRAGALQVSVRVRPVMDWSILLDEMPGCIEGGPDRLRRPDVWEMARHLANGASGAVGEARTRAGEFRVALLEAALDHGVTRLVGSVDIGLLAHGISAWLDLRPIGLPVVYPEGGAAVGYEIPVSEDLIQRLRRAHDLPAAVAYELESAPMPVLTPAVLEQTFRADRPAHGRTPA